MSIKTSILIDGGYLREILNIKAPESLKKGKKQ